MDKELYRKVILEHQLLRPKDISNNTTEDVIKKLTYIQIDSLNIVNRAHHHTLWNRVDRYNLDSLNALIKEKKIFEYWSHAASYLPMDDYKYALVQMNALKHEKNPYVKDANPKDVSYVLDKIKNEGALKARDFKSTSKDEGSWWNWKPYKNALEKLFMEGNLMASRRDGMEKVYDLKSRVLADGVETTEATLNEYASYLIDSTMKSHGVATLEQIVHLRGKAHIKKEVQNILIEKVHSGSIEKHILNEKHALFCVKGMLDVVTVDTQDYLKILSPFDNAVIHRGKLKNIFDFDYKIECYTPKDKRVYGYFCLPILFNDAFVARVDCKAHRKEGILEVIHLHFEEVIVDMDIFALLFSQEMKKYALFNACHRIDLKLVSPSKYLDTIKKELL